MRDDNETLVPDIFFRFFLVLQLPFSPTPKKLAKLGMALALGAALGPCVQSSGLRGEQHVGSFLDLGSQLGTAPLANGTPERDPNLDHVFLTDSAYDTHQKGQEVLVSL